MLVTILTLISIILGSIGVKYIDSVVGILISLWIMLTAIELFRESYNVLMDKSIDNETKDEVLNLIKEHKEVFIGAGCTILVVGGVVVFLRII